MSSEPLIQYVLTARFDNKYGPMLEHEFPQTVTGLSEKDKARIASIMIPSGSENNIDKPDFSVFLLYKNSKNSTLKIIPSIYSVSSNTPPTNNGNGIYGQNDEPVFFLNAVCSKRDPSNERGSTIKAISIGTKSKFFYVLKPLLFIALIFYLDQKGTEDQWNLLSEFSGLLNTLDLSILKKFHSNIILQKLCKNNIIYSKKIFNDDNKLSLIRYVLNKNQQEHNAVNEVSNANFMNDEIFSHRNDKDFSIPAFDKNGNSIAFISHFIQYNIKPTNTYYLPPEFFKVPMLFDLIRLEENWIQPEKSTVSPMVWYFMDKLLNCLPKLSYNIDRDNTTNRATDALSGTNNYNNYNIKILIYSSFKTKNFISQFVILISNLVSSFNVNNLPYFQKHKFLIIPYLDVSMLDLFDTSTTDKLKFSIIGCSNPLIKEIRHDYSHKLWNVFFDMDTCELEMIDTNGSVVNKLYNSMINNHSFKRNHNITNKKDKNNINNSTVRSNVNNKEYTKRHKLKKMVSLKAYKNTSENSSLLNEPTFTDHTITNANTNVHTTITTDNHNSSIKPNIITKTITNVTSDSGSMFSRDTRHSLETSVSTDSQILPSQMLHLMTKCLETKEVNWLRFVDLLRRIHLKQLLELIETTPISLNNNLQDEYISHYKDFILFPNFFQHIRIRLLENIRFTELKSNLLFKVLKKPSDFENLDTTVLLEQILDSTSTIYKEIYQSDTKTSRLVELLLCYPKNKPLSILTRLFSLKVVENDIEKNLDRPLPPLPVNSSSPQHFPTESVVGIENTPFSKDPVLISTQPVVDKHLNVSNKGYTSKKSLLKRNSVSLSRFFNKPFAFQKDQEELNAPHNLNDFSSPPTIIEENISVSPIEPTSPLPSIFHKCNTAMHNKNINDSNIIRKIKKIVLKIIMSIDAIPFGKLYLDSTMIPKHKLLYKEETEALFNKSIINSPSSIQIGEIVNNYTYDNRDFLIFNNEHTQLLEKSTTAKEHEKFRNTFQHMLITEVQENDDNDDDDEEEEEEEEREYNYNEDGKEQNDLKLGQITIDSNSICTVNTDTYSSGKTKDNIEEVSSVNTQESKRSVLSSGKGKMKLLQAFNEMSDKTKKSNEAIEKSFRKYTKRNN
ncbi:Afi1p SCDLUD_003239 [Saccharomycodes ludwigii]|uniref:Afi1p n=1 Tax=Saccharomycodes ludwigii TaxID=36035 RepID=UPI001E8983B2|nr:hypothetical protein SCDLUD_003239 [Saccharomycodes ludwigii]KAH3900267.1 hypothetical protein SCDLUD_003239 [Saccharomycodes ludwigii]